MTPSEDRIVNGEGLVKWFDPKKGFGFVIGPKGEDIFIHYSTIQGEGFRVLKDGDGVQYDAEKSEKGWHATRVVRVTVAVREDEPEEPKPYARTPRR